MTTRSAWQRINSSSPASSLYPAPRQPAWRDRQFAQCVSTCHIAAPPPSPVGNSEISGRTALWLNGLQINARPTPAGALSLHFSVLWVSPPIDSSELTNLARPQPVPSRNNFDRNSVIGNLISLVERQDQRPTLSRQCRRPQYSLKFPPLIVRRETCAYLDDGNSRRLGVRYAA